MISENIKAARKAKGLSQEELAVRLGVVRQTVSKWEKNLSVPDADLLLKMAELLSVPPEQLLGLPERDTSVQGLTEQLVRYSEALAARIREAERLKQAGKKRGLILFLSFLAMLSAMVVKNQAVSLLLIAGCLLAALTVLYRNLALLTGPAAEESGLSPLRIVTVFDIAVLILAAAAILLGRASLLPLSGDGEKNLAMALVAAVMLFGGWISPRLPFNRHTGLRLPWTVSDEETWRVAHRTLGVISLPIALLYLAAAWTTVYFEAATLTAMLLWIGIPGGLSLAFYWKKYHGKL